MSVKLQSVRSLHNGNFLLELRAEELTPTTRTTIVAICDESGSMNGRPFQFCREGLTRLLEFQSPLTVILFSHNARTLVLHNASDVTKIDQVSGGTDFGPPIVELERILPTLDGLLEVIMFTDGQGSFEPTKVYTTLNERCRFHVIGLGSFSDTKALLAIRRLGYESGTFGFAQRPDELTEKIIAVADFNGTGTVVRYRGQFLRLHADEPAFVIVDSLDPSAGETLPPEPSTFEDEMRFIRLRLQTLAENPTEEGITALREAFNSVVELKTSTDLTRSEYQAVLEIATTLNDIAFMLRQHRGSRLPNDALAMINERASQVVTRRFAKLADKRSAAGETRLIAQDTKIAALKAEFANADLTNEPELQCAVSRQSIAELLVEGDCLCISVRGRGKDVVIGNPWLFHVEAVTPTFISFCSFAEAAYYTLKHNRAAIREFSLGADALTKGIAGEEVSGVIPLFISKQHWRMARLYLDRAAAMLICKDPLLGTFQHKLAAVFLTLQWLTHQPNADSEFSRMLHTELSRTLAAVWDARPADTVTPKLFLDNVEKRLPPAIPDLRAAESLWRTLELPLEPAVEFAVAIAEEGWRRDPLSLPPVNIDICGDFTPLLITQCPDDAPMPTFPDGEFQPRLPNVDFQIGFHVDEQLAWRLVAIILQLRASAAVGTTEWPKVRREFTSESAREYIRELGTAYIIKQRSDISAKWVAGMHERRRIQQRTLIHQKTDDELKQEDFDYTSYIGRGKRGSRRSEVGEVLIEWVRTPRQLELAARMKTLDKGWNQYIPGGRLILEMINAHEWITEELLCKLWPFMTYTIHRAWGNRKTRHS
jgi:hypothetical protein